MSETVFIFGAGVSKAAGAPLMNEFLDVADRLRKEYSGGDQSVRDDFDLVFRGKDALQAVHSKATMDLLNLESVFVAFEMAKLLGRLGSLSIEEVNALPRAMSHLIQITLEDQIRFPFKADQLWPPTPYDKIGKLLAEIRSKNYGDLPKSTFITFNYDVCLDYAFFFNSIPIDYCLASDESPSGIKVKLLKLHGSLNWGQCPRCKGIAALTLEEFLRNKRYPGSSSYRLEISRGVGRVRHCESTLSPEPFIAPPTWNKTQHHAQLESVWRAAARELSDAENIVICGYSLPETDQFFRYLYAIGSIGGSGLRKFMVVNPDHGVERRFLELCGPIAKSRFEFRPETIDGTLPILRSLIVR
jgi:hypothetical protein